MQAAMSGPPGYRRKLAPFDLRSELDVLAEFHREWKGSTIGVVYGPRSHEDRLYLERSPRSQLGFTALMETLSSLGFRAVQIDPTADSFTTDLQSPDLLFLNLHGEFGEDGRIQGLLDYLGKSYTGSGVLASALCLDKVMFKRVISSVNIVTPEYATFDNNFPPEEINLDKLQFPVIAKPVSGGSSIGISLIRERSAADMLLRNGHTIYGAMLVEEFVTGQPLTIGILELEHSVVTTPPIEVVHAAEFYDATTKLDESSDGLVKYAVPELPKDLEKKIRSTAIRLHSLLGCRGYSRADFILAEDETVYALEVNTSPGVAYQSNFPAGTQALGLSYEQTVLAMLRSCLWRTDI
jgi:D-alanine-D-alanine ligase